MARLIGLFMLLSLVPLALVTWFTVRQASDAASALPRAGRVGS